MNGFPISYQVTPTAPSTNLIIRGNYIFGGSDAVTLQNTANVTFTNNVFGTDIPWQYAATYADYTTKFHTSPNL